MTLNDLKVLRSKGASSNQRLRKTPTGKQLVGRTLSLELPQRAEARPRSAMRKEQSALQLGLSRPGSAALRLNTLDGVSSVYKRPGPAQDVLEKQRHRRSATPNDGLAPEARADAVLALYELRDRVSPLALLL